MRRWRLRGLMGPLVTVVLLVGLLAACGGSGLTINDPDDHGSSKADGSSGGGGRSGGGGGSDDGLAWVPFGPNDPQIPNDWAGYRALAQRDCDEVASRVDRDNKLWQALIAVCAAAVRGDQDQWGPAAKALAASGGAHLFSDNGNPDLCLEGVVRGLLERALAWHRRHPGRKPAVRRLRVDGRTKCGEEENLRQNPPEVTDPSTEETQPSTEETQPSETTQPSTATTG